MQSSLKLQQQQHLTLTPQLQQAIHLLQLPSDALLDELREAAADNPLLELEEPQTETPETASAVSEDLPRTPRDPQNEAAQERAEEPPAGAAESELDFDSSAWGNASDPDSGHSPLDLAATAETLADHLFAQASVLHCAEAVKDRVLWLIRELNEDGLLEAPLSEIRESFCSFSGSADDEDFLWNEALLLLQNMDPPGIGAWSTQESLLIQLRLLKDSAPEDRQRLLNLTAEAVRECLPELARRDRAKLTKKLGCSAEELKAVYGVLHALNPKPASDFKTSPVQYAVPDILVTRREGVWTASLNPATAPKLSLNSSLSDYLKTGSAQAPEDSEWRTRLVQARAFIRSVEQRYETLLQVAGVITAKQQAFFTDGAAGLVPMVLRDVAEATGLHESTVSRAANGKYLQCPAGVFELKQFFSSGVASEEGEAVSSRAVRAAIRALVEAESSAKPLSDAKLAAALEEQGYHVARRTVAKYRELEGIPAASLRKRI